MDKHCQKTKKSVVEIFRCIREI